MAPKTVWFTGLDENQKKEFQKTLAGVTTLRRQFLKIARSRWDTIERKGFNEEDYNSPDWTHKQAFNNGRLAMLKEIVDLFDFEGELNDQ